MLATTFGNQLVTETPTTDDAAALAQQHGRLVFQAAYRVLGDAALAEDVQQDVFMRLIQARPSGIASWPAFLSAAATRAAIDVLRRQRRWRRWQVLWIDTDAVTAPSAEETSIDTERAERLRTELAKLSRREAQCFGLRYLQGFDIAAIAQALQLSENNVHVTLHRARRRLEVCLGDGSLEITP